MEQVTRANEFVFLCDPSGLQTGIDLALKPGEMVIYNMVDGKPVVLARKVDGGDWKLEGEIVELGTISDSTLFNLIPIMGKIDELPDGEWKITATRAG